MLKFACGAVFGIVVYELYSKLEIIKGALFVERRNGETEIHGRDIYIGWKRSAIIISDQELQNIEETIRDILQRAANETRNIYCAECGAINAAVLPQ